MYMYTNYNTLNSNINLNKTTSHLTYLPPYDLSVTLSLFVLLDCIDILPPLPAPPCPFPLPPLVLINPCPTISSQTIHTLPPDPPPVIMKH